MNGDKWWPKSSSLISDVRSSSSLCTLWPRWHHPNDDLQLSKCVPTTGEGRGEVDVGPKIAFLPGSHVFLCTLVVRCVTDLPKLAWQDLPTGARDNGTEALSSNGTLTKCSDRSARSIEIASEPLLCCTVQLYSQQGLIGSWQTFFREVRFGSKCENVETSAGRNHKQFSDRDRYPTSVVKDEWLTDFFQQQ